MNTEKKLSLVLWKYVRQTFAYFDLQRQVEAYKSLISSDFNLPLNSEHWKFIEESPEFFEDIRGKKLLEEYQSRYKLNHDVQK